MNIAIITGASSGLGMEFARQIDSIFSNMDEIWLIARRKDRMMEFADELDTPCRVIAMDVTNDVMLQQLQDVLEMSSPTVRMLVNCAGYGVIGGFEELSLKEQVGMVEVNCSALVKLTHICLPYMKKNSRIIQIASSAAFIPQPRFSVYAATKSFVLSFSRALNEELRSRKIYVTAVCPGPVATEFFDIAEKNGDILAIKKWVMAEPAPVVRNALVASKAKKDKAVYGSAINALDIAAKMIPHGILLKILRYMK